MRTQVDALKASLLFNGAVFTRVVCGVKTANPVRVTASVVATKPDNSTIEIDLCDAAGRLRVFGNVDDVLTSIQKISLLPDGAVVDLRMEGTQLLLPKPFTGDVIKQGRSQVAAWQKTIVKTAATLTELTAIIALMPSGNAVEIASKAERQAQKDATLAYQNHATAEIARLTALLPPV